MKTKHKKTALTVGLIRVFIAVVLIAISNCVITDLIDKTNDICPGQSFSSVLDAVKGMNDEIDPDDTSIDYTDYRLLTSFEYGEFTAVMCSYREASEKECIIRLLQKNDDGTLSFVGGFTDFLFSPPDGENMNYYYYTNVKTSHGKRTAAFLYLPADSEAEIFIDGHKAEKIPVQTDDKEFYVCAATLGRDTFLKALFVPIDKRHTVRFA